MLSTATKRAAATVVLSGSLLAGASTVPAAASPADEALYLTAMQAAWSEQPASVQKTTCKAYRIAPQTLITQSVAAAWKDPASREALSRPAWKRVITKYLAWACPGGQPR